MTTDTLVRLYKNLINDEHQIDERIQPHLVRTLIDAGEFSLLELFAGRNDVCPEVDAVLADCKDPRVLGTWVLRPGRKLGELLNRLAAEKRVSTLLPIAATQGLPDEVYALLAERRSTRITRALLVNPSLPDSVKDAHLALFVGNIDTEDNHGKHFLIQQLSGSPDRLIEIVTRTESPSTALYALTELGLRWPERTADAVELCVGRIDELLPSDDPDYKYLEHELLELLAGRNLDEGQVKKLRAVVNRRVKSHSKSSRGRLYTAAKEMLSEKGRDKLTQVEELASTGNVARAKTLIRTLLVGASNQNAFPYQHAVDALERNTLLPAAVVRPFLADFSEDGERETVLRWIARGETDIVIEEALSRWCTPGWLDAVEDPLELIKRVVTEATESGNDVPGWVLEYPAVASSPETAIELLPWKALIELAENAWLNDAWDEALDDEENTPTEQHKAAPVDVGLVIRAAQSLIADRLGNDPRKWETFTAIAEEFEGTLPDLLVTADCI